MFDNLFSMAQCTQTEGENMFKVENDKMINYQRIQLKFSKLMKHLLFYIPFKIYKHGFISIDFIALIYELFDNPQYDMIHIGCNIYCYTPSLYLLYKINTINTQHFHCKQKKIPIRCKTVLLTGQQFIDLLPAIKLLTDGPIFIGSISNGILTSQCRVDVLIRGLDGLNLENILWICEWKE